MIPLPVLPEGRPGCPEVVTVGEAMVLLLAADGVPLAEATTFHRRIGGAEANVATGLVRLGHSAAWISRVGDDPFGRAVLLRLRGEGVDVSRVRVVAGGRTGLMVRDRPEGGGPVEVLYHRAGSAAAGLDAGDVDDALVAGARLVLLTGITPALSPSCREAATAMVDTAGRHGVPVVLDANLRLRLWTVADAVPVVRALVERSAMVLAGADEAEALTGCADPEAAGRALLNLGPRLAVVKCGADGVVAVTADGTLRMPAHPARVVDPVGAGDAWAAGLLSALLEDLDLGAALARGARAAAHAVATPGDLEAMPYPADLGDHPDVRR